MFNWSKLRPCTIVDSSPVCGLTQGYSFHVLYNISSTFHSKIWIFPKLQIFLCHLSLREITVCYRVWSWLFIGAFTLRRGLLFHLAEHRIVSGLSCILKSDQGFIVEQHGNTHHRDNDSGVRSWVPERSHYGVWITLAVTDLPHSIRPPLHSHISS